MGITLKIKSSLWVFYLDRPNIITINTEVPLKQGMINNIPVGKIENARWQNDLDLESEENHFFARTKASQVKCLEKFILESVNFVILNLLVAGGIDIYVSILCRP